MPAMRRYYTGLLTMSSEPRNKKVFGRGWEASIGLARSEIGNRPTWPSREIVIKAANARTAQKALNLIKTARELLNCSPDAFEEPFRVIPCNQTEYLQMYPDPLFAPRIRVQTAGFPEACELAAKASRKRAHSYAISLFHVSQLLHANEPMDLNPGLCSKDIRSAEPHDHVRFSYSLIAAYAVLEQLNLALHDKAFHDGKWIPAKRVDLESRLKRAGVDLSTPVIWRLRGGRTALEIRRKTQPLRKAKWAGALVRDEEVDVVDAIADLRWLRSRVAAHDVKDSARLLSVFDVANAQHLARRCILACLGYEIEHR